MSTAQTLAIYKVLQKYFQNDEDASKVVSDLQSIIDQKFEDKKTELATKGDVSELKVDLVSRIEASKTDTIKWMFIFWIGQLAATAGILFAFLNIYFRK